MDAWASPWAEDPADDDSSHRRTVSTIGYPHADAVFSAGASANSDSAQESFNNSNSLATSSFSSTLNQSSLEGNSSLPAADIWARDDNPFAGVSSSSAWANDTPTQSQFSNNPPREEFSGWGAQSSPPNPDALGISSNERDNFASNWGDSNSTSGQLVVKSSEAVDWSQPPDWGSAENDDFSEVASKKSADINSLRDVVPPQEGIGRVSTTDIQSNLDASNLEINKPSTATVTREESTALVPVADNVKPDDQLLAQADGKDGISQNATTTQDEEFGDFDEFEEFEEDVDEKNVTQPAVVGHERNSFTAQSDFNVDISMILKLYPSDPKPPTPPPANDIISTIDARKAWYRISREGTIGKHKSGNSDDYIRITWAKSKIREDVDKIVARWIKEGRFQTGGAIAGDRSYGAMFGWGEGASTRDHSSRTLRYSAPGGGFNLKNVATHRSSASTSNWDPAATTTSKSPELAPPANFGWSSPAISTPPISNRNSLSAITPSILAATPLQAAARSPIIAETQGGNHNRQISSHGIDKMLSLAQLSKVPQNGHLASKDYNGTLLDLKKGTFVPSNAKSQPSFPQKPENSGDNDWSNFESTNLSATTQQTGGEQGNGLQWGSLDFFERDQVQAPPAYDGTKSPSRQEFGGLGLDMGGQDLHLRAGPSSHNPSTSHLQDKTDVDDEEWGEMVTTPTTAFGDSSSRLPFQKSRRPSTAHGDSRPFGLLKPDNWTDLNNGFIRRDSAPSLAFQNSGSTENTSNWSALTEQVKSMQPTPQFQQGGTVNWDFSMFEQPKPAQTQSVNSESLMNPTLHPTGPPVSKDDQVVSDIVGGLPDLGYMLR